MDLDYTFRFVMRMGDRAISGQAAKSLGPLFGVMASTEPSSLEDALRIAGNLSEAQFRITNEEQIGRFRRTPQHTPDVPFVLDSKIVSDTSKPRRLLDEGAMTIEYDGDSKSLVTPSVLAVREEYGILEIDFTQRKLAHRRDYYSRHHRVGAVKTVLQGHPIPELCYELSDAWVLYDDDPTPTQAASRLRKVTLASDKDVHTWKKGFFQGRAERDSGISVLQHQEAVTLYDALIKRIEYKLANPGK